MPAFFVLLLSPWLVEADEWDVLLKDIDLFEETLGADAQAQRDEAQDALFWENSELFPVAGSGAAQVGRQRSAHVAVSAHGETLTFRDVLLHQWHAPYVRDVAERGILSGYRDSLGRPSGLFGAGDPVTVEQLAKIAVETAGIDVTFCATGKPRNRTARQGWSLLYISCAEAQGWSVFRSEDLSVRRPATRAEVVVTILEAFGIDLGPAEGKFFVDVSAASPFAPAIEAAFRSGIVSGYLDARGKPTGRFGPGNLVTRAEVAKIVSLALQRYER